MNFNDEPTGYIQTENPATGKMERMAFWLPEGVNVDDLEINWVAA